MHNNLHLQIDNMRASKHFLGIEETLSTVGKENIILDPYSFLVSRDVKIGKGNTFYPNVVIEGGHDRISIGDNNIFYPGTLILAKHVVVKIGGNNVFGPNGCTIRSDIPHAIITIGNQGRYSDGASIMGHTNLGDGSQILGAITAQSCQLAAGGSFEERNPDKRAAVLKGFGVARGISLEQGQVVNGAGDFRSSPIECQSAYHPKS